MSDIGQQITSLSSFQATDFWKERQTRAKQLNVFAFFKNNNTIFIVRPIPELVIHSFIILFIYLFIYLFIWYLFIYFRMISLSLTINCQL